MYVSPIHVDYTEPFVEKLRDKFNNEVLRAVEKVNIEVDKDELLKALRYDRRQYEKGFKDGLAYKPPICTKADRIKSMTDEDFTTFMIQNGSCPPGMYLGSPVCRQIYSCRKCWLDWLKQEA